MFNEAFAAVGGAAQTTGDGDMSLLIFYITLAPWCVVSVLDIGSGRLIHAPNLCEHPEKRRETDGLNVGPSQG